MRDPPLSLDVSAPPTDNGHRGGERVTTLREIADALNEHGVRTARGGQWYAMIVLAQA